MKLAKDKGDTDYINTISNETQVETISKWVGCTESTLGEKGDLILEEG